MLIHLARNTAMYRGGARLEKYQLESERTELRTREVSDYVRVMEAKAMLLERLKRQLHLGRGFVNS